jgi:hypothetical protein
MAMTSVFASISVDRPDAAPIPPIGSSALVFLAALLTTKWKIDEGVHRQN